MPIQLTADDYAEIYQLYARYAIALDTGDGDAYVATFTPTGKRRGIDMPTFKEWVDRKGENRMLPLGSRHMNFNIVLTPTDEGVDGVSILLFLLGSFEDEVVRGQFGVYNDKIVKTADGWKFQERNGGDQSPDSPFGRIMQPVPKAPPHIGPASPPRS